MTLINLIFESYTTILCTIVGLSLLVFALGLYLIVREPRKPAKLTNPINLSKAPTFRLSDKLMLPDTANDVTAIAGDDPMSTQLDLARAYIETGKMQFAKIILKTVLREGSTAHQEEAQRLLGSI